MRIPLTEIRNRLNQLSTSETIITDIEGVKLFEQRNSEKDRRDRIDCINYTYRENVPHFREIEEFVFAKVPFYAEEVQTPQEGDLVVYLRNSWHVHIGRIALDGNVCSKWGFSHVYLHRPELVPTRYGEEIRFFREQVNP